MARTSNNRTIVVWLVVLGLLLATCIVTGMLIGGILRQGTSLDTVDPVNPADTLAYLQRAAMVGWDEIALDMLAQDPHLLDVLAAGDVATRRSLYSSLMTRPTQLRPELCEKILAESDPYLVQDWVLLLTKQLNADAGDVLSLGKRVSDDPRQLSQLLQGSDFQAPLLSGRVVHNSTAADLLVAVAQLSGTAERAFLENKVIDEDGEPIRIPLEADPFSWLYARRDSLTLQLSESGWAYLLEREE